MTDLDAGNPSERAFNDILDALYRLRAAFLKNGMKPPISLELGSLPDSDRFRWLMPHDLVMAQPRMGESKADAEWVCNIMGIEVRMPAQWRRDLKGRNHLV